jgi:serine/threonine protein kinase
VWKERQVNSSGDLGHLQTRQWKQLQDMASRFEAAWQQSETADLASFLPPPGNPLRRVALLELIKTDLEARWRRGQIIGVEAYLEKFPELGNVAILAPQLIYEEYRVRHLYGDKPALAGYERRFPRQFPELKRLASEQPIPTAVGPAPEAAPDIQSVAIDKVLRIGGGYKLIKRIGLGGFAEVWQAETPGGFPVAIKCLLRPLDHAEAQLELRALGEIKRLSHPYLLQTRDYDLLDNRLYIAMDLADCTLSDRLHACKGAGIQGIPLDELLRYIREAAEVIDYMHGEKVHHRDIKPKNILLHKGHAKVADFGLARMIESQRMTVTGSGTAPYMAPEIWKRQFSDSSDLYSLAVSYVELRIGRMPFAGTDMYSLMMEHLEGKPNLDPLPKAEQEVLRKALSKDPDARYPSCLAFVEALEAAVEPLRQQQAPVSDSRRRRSTVQRRLANTEAIDRMMRPDDTPPHAPPEGSDDARPLTQVTSEPVSGSEMAVRKAPRSRRGGSAVRGIIAGTGRALIAKLASLGRRRKGSSEQAEPVTGVRHSADEPASEIRRYTDVSFPAKAATSEVHTLRVQLVPAEEVLPSGKLRVLPRPHAHDAVMSLKIPQPDRAGLPPAIHVMASVAAENFAIEGPSHAELVVPLDGPTASFPFRLRALEPGPGRIMVDFTQDGRPVGSVDLYPEVVHPRTWLGAVARLILIPLLTCSGASCTWATAPDSNASALLSGKDWPWFLLIGVIVLCGVVLFWSLQHSRRRAAKARAEGARFLALRLYPSQPPDVILKVFELRYADQPGRLHFHLYSTHPALQDLPVLDGDLGTCDLKSDVAGWVANQLQILGDLARRTDTTSEQVDKALANVGYQLYEQLLPEKLQALCWTFRQRGVQSMLVLSDEPHIPWELIKPYCLEPISRGLEKSDDVFWGEAFALTHWLRGRPPVHQLTLRRVFALATGAATAVRDPAQATRDMILLSSGADASPSPLPLAKDPALPSAEEELAILRSLENAGARVEILPARRRQLCEALEQGEFDLLHLACHGSFDGPSLADTAAVLMEDGAFRAAELSPRMAGALRSAAPLIFFNACQSGRLGFALTRLGSWGARLVQLGCGGFVGALWPVTDQAAVEFARAFYGCLVRGEPLGLAIRQARNQVRCRYPHDPSWLAYRCFADPMARIYRDNGNTTLDKDAAAKDRAPETSPVHA